MNKSFAKLIDNAPTYAPDTLVYDGRMHTNPPRAAYLAAGWKDCKDEPPTPPEGFYERPTGWAENDTTVYRTYEEVAIEPTPRHLSKYSFIKCLKADGFFEQFMALVKADDYTYQLWLSAEYLDEGDDTFAECREQAKAALGVDDAIIDAFLAKVEEA